MRDDAEARAGPNSSARRKPWRGTARDVHGATHVECSKPPPKRYTDDCVRHHATDGEVYGSEGAHTRRRPWASACATPCMAEKRARAPGEEPPRRLAADGVFAIQPLSMARLGPEALVFGGPSPAARQQPVQKLGLWRRHGWRRHNGLRRLHGLWRFHGQRRLHGLWRLHGLQRLHGRQRLRGLRGPVV